MFLEHLDTIIAFAMVMLLLSLLVTVFVQAVISLLGLRGRNLVWGIEQLVRELDPAFEEDARELALEVLSYPVIATTTNRFLQFLDWLSGVFQKGPYFNKGKRAPTAVRAKEVILVLDRIRRGESIGRTVKSKLDDLLDTDALFAVPHLGAAPDLVSDADAESGNGDEAGASNALGPVKKIEVELARWFDVVMDATSERFKLRARWITAVGAVILAFGFQLDSASILKRLSEDPGVRAQLVNQVVQVDSLYRILYGPPEEEENAGSAEPGGETDAITADEAGDDMADMSGTDPGTQETVTDQPESDSSPAQQELEVVGKRIDTVLEEIYATELVSFDRVEDLNQLGEDFGGKLATVLLLSLGAPFWYKVLSDLVGFRSVVAKKHEEESIEAPNTG